VPRFFTLLEAEQLLPTVERLLRTIIDRKREYDSADAELGRIAQRVALSGGMIPPRDEILAYRRAKQTAAQSLKSTLESLQETGCQLKDVETGLIDFPTLYKDKEVYLCWKLGEAGIGFWHYVEDGFRGRKPIDQDFLRNHRGDVAS